MPSENVYLDIGDGFLLDIGDGFLLLLGVIDVPIVIEFRVNVTEESQHIVQAVEEVEAL